MTLQRSLSVPCYREIGNGFLLDNETFCNEFNSVRLFSKPGAHWVLMEIKAKSKTGTPYFLNNNNVLSSKKLLAQPIAIVNENDY